MTDGFQMDAPLHGLLSGIVQVLHSPLGVSATHKMLRELRGHFPSLRPIVQLQPPPDRPVPAHPPTHRYPVVDKLAMQVVEKPIAARHRPIHPGLSPAPAHHLAPAGQSVILCFDVFHRAVDPSRHRRGREFHSRHTRHFQQLLVHS
jgi:hypothetical protein